MQRVLFAAIVVLTGCSSAETVVAPPAAPVRQQPPTATTQKFALARFESTSPASGGESGTSPPVSAPAPPPALPAPARQQSCAGWPHGTAVGVEETTRGAAMVFTNSDDINALRTRVTEQRDTGTSNYTVHLDNVRQGVRVVYEPKSGDKDQLREAIELRARELSKACELSWARAEEEPKEKPSRAGAPVTEPPTPWLPVESQADKKPEAKDKAGEPAKPDEDKDEKADDKKPDDKKADDKKPEADKKPQEKKPEGDKKPDDKKPDDKKPDDKKPGDKKPDDDKPSPPKDGDKPKDPFAPPAPKT